MQTRSPNIKNNALYKLIHQHKLLLLMQKTTDLPPAWQKRCFALRLRNLLLVSELHRVACLFRSHRIPFLAIKGPVLSYLAYGDAHLRQSVDLDLIVHKKNLGVCRKILLKNKYRFYANVPSLGETAYQFTGTPKQAKILLELHWKVAPSFWRSRRIVSLSGEKIPTFSNENTLIWICVNADKDGWNSLSHIIDLMSFLSRHKINLPKLLKKLQKTVYYKPVLKGLLLMQDLYGQKA